MYLIYCIFKADGSEIPSAENLAGPDGWPVVLISESGFTAAVSRIRPEDLAPELSRILAYQKVIEVFHGARTVIPMRYGAVLENEDQVIRHLNDGRSKYSRLLGELDGCVEMGVRGIVDGGLRGGEREAGEGMADGEHMTPGRRYLAVRKAFFSEKEAIHTHLAKRADMVRSEFSDLFVQSKTDPQPFSMRAQKAPSSDALPAFSLYFLVRRESMEAFRTRFRRLRSRQSLKLLLSGPWPPFNFVS